MIKEDFSHIYAKPEAPVFTAFSATLRLNIISETQELADETMQMLIDYFNKFNDVEILKAVWDE